MLPLAYQALRVGAGLAAAFMAAGIHQGLSLVVVAAGAIVLVVIGPIAHAVAAKVVLQILDPGGRS